MSSNYFDKYKRRLQRNGNDVGEALSNNTIAFIESTFHASPTYRKMEVYRYGEPMFYMDARVVEVERLGSLREIILPPNKSLEAGTYVKFDGYTWLLYDKYGGTGSTSIKLLAIRCNRTIKWKKDGEIFEYDCVASATDIGSKAKQSKNELEWNKYDVSLPLGQLFITFEANPDTIKINMNDRFIFGRSVYEVTGIDDITGRDENDYGYIQLTVKLDVIRDGDDFETGIAVQNDDSTETPPVDDGDTENGGLIW